MFATTFAAAAPSRSASECVPFALLPELGALEGAQGVALADLDGDGNLDAVATALESGNENTYKVVWFANEGGNFPWSPQTIAVVDGPYAITTADLDGDGDADVVVSVLYDSRVVWFENDGTGAGWTEHEASSGTNALAVFSLLAADVDRDGDLDLATASSQAPRVLWLENQGGSGSTWSAHTVSLTSAFQLDVAAADFDRDGHLDLASSGTSTDFLAWHENDGTPASGIWTARTISTRAGGFNASIAGDLDGDGDADLVAIGATDRPVLWFENDGTPTDGGWSLHTVAASVADARELRLSDADGDGDADLWVRSPGAGTLIWFEQSDADWIAHTAATNLASVRALIDGDLDGDGDLDLVATHYLQNRLTWLRNDQARGTALFGVDRVLNPLFTLSAPYQVLTADLDGDGDPDAVATGLADSNGAITLFENAGAGSSWLPITLPLGGSDSRAAAVDDLDGDGDLDIVSAERDPDEIVWYESSDAGTTWSIRDIRTQAPAPGAVRSLATGDVDRDGDVDVVAGVDFGSDPRLMAFRNPGTGDAWTQKVASTRVQTVFGVALADLDRDGDLDAVTADYDEGTVSWFANDGLVNGGAWTKVTIAPVPFARAVAVGDLDRDGDLDVVAGADASDALVWFESDGSPDAGWTARTLLTQATVPNSVAVGDFDRDGDLDLLVAEQLAGLFGYENDGTPDDGGWIRSAISTSLAGAYSTVAGDLDGDGDLDSLTADVTANKLVWHENRGTLVFSNGLDTEADGGANLACWSADVP